MDGRGVRERTSPLRTAVLGLTHLRVTAWHRHLPPRPENHPRHAGDRRRAAGDGRGRHPLSGPHRRHAGGVRRGGKRRRRVHALEMSFGAGRVVPRPDQGRTRPRAGGQFRQCQRVHRQERPRGVRVHRQARGRRRRLQDDGSVSRFDRRHRRAAAGASIRRRHGASGRGCDRRRLRRRRQARS